MNYVYQKFEKLKGFKLVKNRYEILFFNKFELILTLLLLKNYNLLSINNNSLNKNNSSENTKLENTNSKNKERINNFENKISKEIIHRISDEKEENNKKYFDKLITNIRKLYEKNPISFINSDNLIFLNKILKNTCYLRTYFRYTDNTTLQNRFNGKKDIEFIFVYNKIQNYFKKKMISDILKNKSKSNNVRNKSNKNFNNLSLEKELKETIIQKPLDTDSDIKKKLSQIKSINNKNAIESVLEEISKNTKGYINCCIVFDIKKTKLSSINNVNVYFFQKITNYHYKKIELQNEHKKEGLSKAIEFAFMLLLGILSPGMFLISDPYLLFLIAKIIIAIIIGIIILALFIAFVSYYYGKFTTELKYIDFNALFLEE